MSQQYPHIFEPFTVKRTTFRNRVIMPLWDLTSPPSPVKYPKK